VICIGDVNGHCGPRQYKELIVPWNQEYVPLLHDKNKLIYNHAHSSYLKAYEDLLLETGLDMVDAFTPSPVGDLSVAEARAAWGNRIVISVSLPETIFWSDPEASAQYTRDLIQQGPTRLLIITATKMDASVIADDRQSKPTSRA
jgi:hypothetical protein